MQTYYIGVDVGGTKIAYGIFDAQRRLQYDCKYPSDALLQPGQFADMIVGHITDMLGQQELDRANLGGVGMCFPSFVDYANGRVIRTANLPHLKNFAARDYFEKALAARVMIDNDGNAAALAEHRYGAGRGYANMLYCPISTGIGTGIIIDNKVFRGSYGWAGECGHMIADVDTGDDFESHVSGGHIVKRLAQKIREGERSVLSEMCGGDLERLNAHHLEDAYNLGDPLAVWGVNHMAKYLGVWLYNLYLTFNNECFVFGGGLVNMGDILFRPAREVFDAHNQDDVPVQFRFAELGQKFGIIGAAELLFQD